LNTSNTKIVLTIDKNPEGWVIYDDTQTFIEFVPNEKTEILLNRVQTILEGRINDTGQTSFW
jgi:hypothetical protein